MKEDPFAWLKVEKLDVVRNVLCSINFMILEKQQW